MTPKLVPDWALWGKAPVKCRAPPKQPCAHLPVHHSTSMQTEQNQDIGWLQVCPSAVKEYAGLAWQPYSTPTAYVIVKGVYQGVSCGCFQQCQVCRCRQLPGAALPVGTHDQQLLQQLQCAPTDSCLAITTTPMNKGHHRSQVLQAHCAQARSDCGEIECWLRSRTANPLDKHTIKLKPMCRNQKLRSAFASAC